MRGIALPLTLLGSQSVIPRQHARPTRLTFRGGALRPVVLEEAPAAPFTIEDLRRLFPAAPSSSSPEPEPGHEPPRSESSVELELTDLPSPSPPPPPPAPTQPMLHIEIPVPRACWRCIRRLQADIDHVCVRSPGRVACDWCVRVKDACEPVSPYLSFPAVPVAKGA